MRIAPIVLSIGAPASLGATGVFLVKQDSSRRLNEIFLKTSEQIKANKKIAEDIKKTEDPTIIPEKNINLATSSAGIFYHMWERERVNGCKFTVSMNGIMHDLPTIYNQRKGEQYRLWSELEITDWIGQGGREVVDESCFMSSKVSLERFPSAFWKGRFYWEVIGRDNDDREVWRSWFWQRVKNWRYSH